MKAIETMFSALERVFKCLPIYLKVKAIWAMHNVRKRTIGGKYSFLKDIVENVA